ARGARRGLARPALPRRRRPRERAGGGGHRDGHAGGHRDMRRRARGGAGMSLNRSGWRPETSPAEAGVATTFTGNRALTLEEPLTFEIGTTGATGVDFDIFPELARGGGSREAADGGVDRLGALARSAPIGLPGLSEPEAVRHYTRLSSRNYAIDLGVFPLGSCTMKHNPRLNEKVARLPGFADLHPLAPIDTVQGALAVIH